MHSQDNIGVALRASLLALLLTLGAMHPVLAQETSTVGRKVLNEIDRVELRQQEQREAAQRRWTAAPSVCRQKEGVFFTLGNSGVWAADQRRPDLEALDRCTRCR